jgi:enterobactin synthetase component D
VLPDVAFDFALEHGRCFGVRMPAADEAVTALAEAALAPGECAFAAGLPPLRRRTWVGGRVALRQALARAGMEAPAVLADDRGAPALPAGVAGSITHKEGLAAALVDRQASARLGVDLELDVVRTQDISRRVLAQDELSEVAGLDAEALGREVLLRFSAKEAIYKAIDPFVRRYVGFTEVSVSPHADGRAEVRARLRPGEGPFVIEVRWLRFEGVVLTTALAFPA